MERFDVIILTRTETWSDFEVVQRCIRSYLDTAGEDRISLINKIVVIESGNWNEFKQAYSWIHSKVTYIHPNESFNYNKFYNIALRYCTAEFVIGPNNDLIIQPNCLQNIAAEFDRNPKIQSICPIDRGWHRHTHMYFPNEDKLYYGYTVALHMFGAIFCCRRSIFEKIGPLDERFFFFYQDNDYALTLKEHGLHHGILTSAHVKHKTNAKLSDGDERCKYTPKNMNEQGDILFAKWGAAKLQA